ncbi:MAG: uroporphyrinogen decarboxylase family protein [Clostridia bacterium]
MNAKQRFYDTVEYRLEGRPATKYYGTPEIHRDLMEHLGVSSVEEIRRILGDDFRGVSPKYIGPELKKYEDGSWEGLHGERYVNYSFGHGTYPEPVYLPFKDIEDPETLKDFVFPTADWYDYSSVEEDCDRLSSYAIAIEGAGTPDFMNGIARYRGVEQVMLDVATQDPVYLELVEKRFSFLHEKSRRTLEAGRGKIDILGLGEDLGNQNGLLISPTSFDRLFADKLKAFIDLAHRYKAKAMMHCCGSCRKLIPRFIELGLDILEVVQVDAAGMDIRELHKEFYGKIAFCGSVSVQSVLPFGTVEDVRNEVALRKELFREGGLIVAPTHHIQAGTPVENILALYRELGSLE